MFSSPAVAYLDNVLSDLDRRDWLGAPATPMWTIYTERADVQTLSSAAAALAVPLTRHSFLVVMVCLLVIARREPVATAVHMILSESTQVVTQQIMMQVVDAVANLFAVAETRWGTKRPTGGIDRLRTIVNNAWHDVVSFAWKLEIVPPTEWSMDTINSALSPSNPVYLSFT